jgi:hypothetical protein
MYSPARNSLLGVLTYDGGVLATRLASTLQGCCLNHVGLMPPGPQALPCLLVSHAANPLLCGLGFACLLRRGLLACWLGVVGLTP